MRILHIMASRGLGGAETYSTDVILSLHQAGISQCVVMAKQAPRYAELERAGVTMVSWVLSVPLRPVQRMLMRYLVAREKPTIIHCWMRRAATIAPKQKIKSKNPNDKKLNTSLKTIVSPTVIGWFGGYYNPRHFRSCTYFVGVTKDIVAHIIKCGVASERARYIPTFPDVATLAPIDRAQLATPKTAKVLLALSRLHPKKGLDILLTALKDLPECYVWLAGDGPLRRKLETLAKDLGVLDRVRFLGWRTDRAALLRSADVCVLPSRYEPFGTVILEAWAAGTPLVACESAGPAAHIDDGVNGLLVPIDDAASLGAAISHALGDDNLRRRLIAQGYAAYIKSFTREAVTREWIRFYKRVSEDS
jgi:glycosyltransferase involved in cell wall biosynthesis